MKNEYVKEEDNIRGAHIPGNWPVPNTVHIIIALFFLTCKDMYVLVHMYQADCAR